MAFIINGVAVKTPNKFEWTIQSIDGSETGRNANGDMVRDYITDKVKLDIGYPPLNDSEISTILKAINHPSFSVTYPDALEGRDVTKTFYVGDRKAPSYSWNKKFNEAKWKGLEFSLIEM